MKACTGRFTPLKQWFYFDAVECLPVSVVKDGTIPEELEAGKFDSETRYQGQIRIFGEKFQKTLGDLNYFIVIFYY